MIYFLQSVNGGPIKIGFSTDIQRRHAELETHYDQPLVLLATMKGDRRTESEIHHRFAHLRLGRTEQFRPGPELMAFIGRPLFVNQGDVELMDASRAGTLIRVSVEFSEAIKEAASFDKFSISEYATKYLLPIIEKRYKEEIVKKARRLEGRDD